VNPDDYQDIFEPFERLVEIKILGKTYSVPENNTLLRCFQYLSLNTISGGDFCWNSDCMNCQIWIDNNGKEKALIACRAKVHEGMEIVRLHEEVELEMD
jgi:NADH dehydrogenase/NADH:ubiquinone oxidoreductase subunit G